MISKIETAFKERLAVNKWLDEPTRQACDDKVYIKYTVHLTLYLLSSYLRSMQSLKWWLTQIIFMIQPNCFLSTIQLVSK